MVLQKKKNTKKKVSDHPTSYKVALVFFYKNLDHPENAI